MDMFTFLIQGGGHQMFSWHSQARIYNIIWKVRKVEFYENY